jgi:hypothetical protein
MDHKKPEKEVRHEHLDGMAVQGNQAKENYAEHLARVTPDADHNKALLQAHYKALHNIDPDYTDHH